MKLFSLKEIRNGVTYNVGFKIPHIIARDCGLAIEASMSDVILAIEANSTISTIVGIIKGIDDHPIHVYIRHGYVHIYTDKGGTYLFSQDNTLIVASATRYLLGDFIRHGVTVKLVSKKREAFYQLFPSCDGKAYRLTGSDIKNGITTTIEIPVGIAFDNLISLTGGAVVTDCAVTLSKKEREMFGAELCKCIPHQFNTELMAQIL